ncbi:TetR/AcrR family transcriptional regulator [Nocardioides marmoriginsengisoli]|uniref:TetR/AcrR family transcriptional regulator n=1 Tax=Nocardioides marmoriginsengisoli TaxID=661483 RepID=A0A3N0CI62_9ACTN|nr:TetR/AcrR family transcriptional regulator [Nocardioides marmoriginsengisoli]RNL63115.1 TetR/AcrR family transcriptional regulator [Nocardioides marmoriginsengisoli]
MPSRSPAEKIRATLPKVPKVPVVSRRAQYSASTKRALVDEALKLFTDQGYAATSLDAIVTAARVTKGALYHHFTGKQAVFEAVFEQIEADASAQIRTALKKSKDPWDKALIGLRAFLQIVQDASYQRVVIQEGPAVLGYERFREQEERSSYGLVQEMVRLVLEDSAYDLSEDMLETFSRIFFGAMSAAGESVSTAANPKVAVAQVETAIAFILAGLRSLAESGVALPDPEDLLPDDEDDE